jgi:hypothetical protein
LLCAAAIASIWLSPQPISAMDFVLPTLLVLIILVLGPWWPGQDKAHRWKLNLPTDNPAIAAYLLSFYSGAVFFLLGLGRLLESGAHLPSY